MRRKAIGWTDAPENRVGAGFAKRFFRWTFGNFAGRSGNIHSDTLGTQEIRPTPRMDRACQNHVSCSQLLLPVVFTGD